MSTSNTQKEYISDAKFLIKESESLLKQVATASATEVAGIFADLNDCLTGAEEALADARA